MLRTLFSVVILHLPYWNPQKKCPSGLSTKVSYNLIQQFYLMKTVNQMFPSLHWLKKNSDRPTSSKMKSTHMRVYVCCVYATDLGFLNPYISCFFKLLDFCFPLPSPLWEFLILCSYKKFLCYTSLWNPSQVGIFWNLEA